MTFQIQFILLALIALGYLSKKLGVLKHEDAQPLSAILINFMLPALIISNFATSNINAQLGLMTLSAVLILFPLLGIGWLISRKYEVNTARTVILLMGSYWGATLAFPFIIATFGQEGLKIFLFYDLIQALLIPTIIPLIAQGSVKSFKPILLLKNPLFMALIIGLGMNYLKLSIPFATELLNTISSGTVFIGLLIVGLNLELKVDQWKRPLFIIIVKTIVGLALALLVVWIFKFEGIYRSIIILAATLPPSLMVVIFSQKYNLDKKLAANTLTIALPISIFVMTLVSLFVT